MDDDDFDDDEIEIHIVFLCVTERPIKITQGYSATEQENIQHLIYPTSAAKHNKRMCVQKKV